MLCECSRVKWTLWVWEAHPEWDGDVGAASTEPSGAAASTGGGALAPALLHKTCSFFQCLLSGVEAVGKSVLPSPVGCPGGLMGLGGV